MRPLLRIHRRKDHEIIAQLGAVVIRLVGGGVTMLAGMFELFEIVEQALRDYPIAATLIVVEHGSPVPGGEVRRCIDEHLEKHADRLVTGYALLGLGFWAQEALDFANNRARLEACTILVDIDLGQLTERLAHELVGIDPEQLAEACEQLRAELRSRGS
jgi:hypothetical protein